MKYFDLWAEANEAKKRVKDLEATLNMIRARLEIAERRAEMAEQSARHAWRCAAE